MLVKTAAFLMHVHWNTFLLVGLSEVKSLSLLFVGFTDWVLLNIFHDFIFTLSYTSSTPYSIVLKDQRSSASLALRHMTRTANFAQ